MAAKVHEIEQRASKFSKQLEETIPASGQRRIPRNSVENFKARREFARQLMAEVRQLEPTKEQAVDVCRKFQALKTELEDGLILIKARYGGDPCLKELSTIIRSTIKLYDDLLIDLKVLLDAFEGRPPAEIRLTLGKTWEQLLDHILLYHEIKAREGESGGEITLREIEEKYGL